MSDKTFFSVLEKFCKGKGLSFNRDKAEADIATLKSEEDNQQLIQKSHDQEKRITVEVICEPLVPDAHDDYYTKETIEKGFESFDKAWKEGRLPMNLFHAYDDHDKQHVELLKHYLVPFDCQVPNPRTGELTDVKEGTWIAEVKWHNEDLWKQRTTLREDGTTAIGGLSIRGWGKRVSKDEE